MSYTIIFNKDDRYREFSRYIVAYACYLYCDNYFKLSSIAKQTFHEPVRQSVSETAIKPRRLIYIKHTKYFKSL